MLALLAILVSGSAHAASLPTPGALQLSATSSSDTEISVYTRYDLDTVDQDAVSPSLLAFFACSIVAFLLSVLQQTCNDGSPAFYYFKAGSGTGASSWVI